MGAVVTSMTSIVTTIRLVESCSVSLILLPYAGI